MPCRCCDETLLFKLNLNRDIQPDRVLAVLKDDSLCKSYRDRIATIVAGFRNHPNSPYSKPVVAFALGWVNSHRSTGPRINDEPDEYDHTDLIGADDAI